MISNVICVNFSTSMLDLLKKMSRKEGLSLSEYTAELAKEGVFRKIYSNKNNKNQPNNLMTMNGYIDDNEQKNLKLF